MFDFSNPEPRDPSCRFPREWASVPVSAVARRLLADATAILFGSPLHCRCVRVPSGPFFMSYGTK
jgi:hypothetical protein